MAYTTLAETQERLKSVDISKMTPAQKVELAELLEAKKRYEDENQLLLYRPYPKQMEFHAAGASNRERLLMSGNQLGKCATADSFLEHPDGTRSTFGDVYSRRRPVPVLSWDGQAVVPAEGIEPIQKEAQPCVRLWFSDGSWFGCALNHRILSTDREEYLFVSELIGLSLPASGGDRLPSSLEPDPSVRVSSGPSSLQRLPGFLAGCLAGLRFCDARLHAAQDSARAWLRRQGDAPRRSSALTGADGCLTKRGDSRISRSPHHSSPGALLRFADQTFGFADRVVCMFARYTRRSTQAVQRLLLASLSLTRSSAAVRCGQSLKQAFVTPSKAGNQLVAYEVIPTQPVYDISVPEYGNYTANGLVHHNTYSAAAETAMHLTGRYPEWWGGKRFNRPPKGLAAGVTAQLVRDSMQVLLCGYPARELGHGMIPKDCIASEPIAARSITGAYDTVKVKHVSGGESTLYLRAYEQGREKVQAMTLEFCWLDEEPDIDYYTEALTRTNVAFGPVYMTFTPLKGMSQTVARFLLEGQGNVTNMTIDDVAHYTEAQKAAIVAQYPPHEREARLKGIPMMGSGKVYPIEEGRILTPAFQIPEHWPRLVGLDFGYEHPTAAVWVAHDRDTDTVYVYDAYRVSQASIPVHAAAIKARGDWIPVAWPHDGYAITSASHGEPLAQQYRQQGVAMRSSHAQFPETQAEGDRKMSRISTEAAIQSVLTRMEAGTFKVFDHLSPWVEEFRTYHRKDGILVKVRDDLMSATHKAIMDLRFAELKPKLSDTIDHNRRSDGLY